MTTMRKSAPHLQMISASNVAELSPLCTLRSQQASAIHDIKFSPDGERLATLNANGLVEIWDVMAFHHLFQVDTEAMFEHGHGLTFNVDGSRLLVTGSADKL